jgi:penicillin-binding protein 1A
MLFFMWHGLLGFMPSLSELENPDTALATEVISSDGKIIGKYYSENQIEHYLRTSCLACLTNALLATEDIRFYDHSGIDMKAIARGSFWRTYF